MYSLTDFKLGLSIDEEDVEMEEDTPIPPFKAEGQTSSMEEVDYIFEASKPLAFYTV